MQQWKDSDDEAVDCSFAGVFLSPHYATDHSVYLTYVEPGDYGGALAMGRGRLVLDGERPALEGFQVLWRQVPSGKGGQRGMLRAFAKLLRGQTTIAG